MVSTTTTSTRLGRLATLMLVATIAACSGNTASESSATNGAAPDAATSDGAEAGPFAGMGLSTSTAEQFDRITITGVGPDDVPGPLSVEVIAEGSDASYLPVYHDVASVFIVAPLHPTTATGAGPVTLRFTDGEHTGADLALDLTGLPDAPGAWGRFVDDTVAAIDAEARVYGSSFDELATDPDDLAGPLVALDRFQNLVENGTDGDLESLLDPLPAEQLAVAESIVAKLAPAKLLSAADAEPEGLRRPTAQPHPLSYPAPTQATSGCIDLGPTIESEQDLADAIEHGKDNTIRPGGAEDQVLTGIQSAVEQASDLPEPYGGLIGAIGTGFSALRYYKDIQAGIYPQGIDQLSAQVGPTEFNEDFTEHGSVENVVATATSKGYDGGDLVSDLASAVYDKAKSKALEKIDDKQFEESVDEAEEMVGEAQELADALAIDTTNQFLENLKANLTTLCPGSWEITLKSSTWVKIGSRGGLLDIDEAAFTYEPNKVGTDTLWVRADPDAFHGATAEAQTEIVTEPLRVIVRPDVIFVQRPGEPVDVTTELEHADTTTLYWNPKTGSWADRGGSDDTNEAGTRSYNTSSDPDDYPYIIHVDSTSDTGLRATATDIRSDQVTVRLSEIEIHPEPASVKVEKQLGFTATDRNRTEVEVNWTATGGTINADGVYTAGKNPGIYEVTATLRSDPAVSVTIAVEVREGTCFVGAWEIDTQAFLDQVSKFADEPIQLSDAGGSWYLDFFEDGTYDDVRDNWAFQVSAQGVTGTVTWNGTGKGWWKVAGDRYTGDQTSGSLSVSMTSGGMSIPIGTTDVAGSDGVAGSGTFECDGNRMTWHSDDGVTIVLNAR